MRWLTTLSEGIACLSSGGIDAILLSLSRTQGEQIDALDRLALAAPQVPTVVLAGPDDEDLARQAVQAGADDYLLKDYINKHTLPRALSNAIKRRAIEDALFTERDRAHVTLNSIGDAVLSTDISGNVTYLNRAAEALTGWSTEEALGRAHSEVFRIIDGATRSVALDAFQLAMRENTPQTLGGDCVLIRRDGLERSIEDSTAPIHDRSGKITGSVIVFRDVTDSREMKGKVAHLALHDPLTDLPNRNLLNDRIAQAGAGARRHGNQFAVLFLDIDRFKLINDTHGHAAGDRLLRSVAERLLACVRKMDTVARLGGDEFVVLLSEIEHAEDVGAVAAKILVALAASHRLAPYDMHITVSIGISVYPGDGEDAETLIQNADVAMYHGRDHGRNSAKFFTQHMHVRVIEKRSLEAGLRGALQNGAFALQYQPKINLATGAITGAEALLRWHHPSRGMILPGLFVPIAEENHLIVPIGHWVLREACMQAQAWRDSGLAMLQIAVNISAIEFRAADFLRGVKQILKETGLAPNCLELEMTESALMRNAESTASLLKELKAMGVQLAIDDFGTGYSSLSYLSRFPIDTLKIDQSFVSRINSDSGSATLVSTMINMAKSLKQRVVAEGVETPQQLDFLQTQNCDEGQGYLFSHPVGAKEFATMLEVGLQRA